MITYTIKKNHHYSSGISLKTYYNEKSIYKKIIFTESCKYNLQLNDQYDINKLFGIGYLPWHRYCSVRFGWRYSVSRNKIEIFAYWYKKRKRNDSFLALVDLNKKYGYFIDIKKDYHELILIDEKLNMLNSIKVDVPKQSFGYSLKPYFGGNRRAPHTMKIEFY